MGSLVGDETRPPPGGDAERGRGSRVDTAIPPAKFFTKKIFYLNNFSPLALLPLT